MKINYDFYKGSDLYSDGSIEDEIIKYEEDYFGKIDEVFKNDIRWPVFYHLTPIRKNIVNWYPFKKDSSLLEIGAGMGGVTEAFCEKCKEVVSVELSKRRATSIATRNKDKDNLEIIVGNLNDIDFGERKFDYISLIGVLEYAALFTSTENPYEDFIKNIKKLLKEDGKLLIAIENKFGMKYWLGAPEDHTNVKYDGITGYQNDKTIRTFGKQELAELLSKCGLKNSKFYYPLPDYKLPEIIFSDEYLPDDKTIENYIPYYYEGTKTEFDEKLAYKQVIKEGKFDFFANSFFVEASEKSIDTKVDLKDAKLIKISENSKRFYDKTYNKDSEVEEIKRENEQLRNELNGLKNSRLFKLRNKFKK